MEQENIFASLKGRIQYFQTNYRGAHDQTPRIAIRFDGEEIFRSDYFNGAQRHELRERLNGENVSYEEFYKKVFHLVSEQGGTYRFFNSFYEYHNNSIDKSLVSPDAMVRLFAILDRRVGTRRLEKLLPEIGKQPEWLQVFFKLRLDAEKSSRDKGNHMLEKHIESLQERIIAAVQDSIRIASVKGEAAPDMPYGAKPTAALNHALGLAQSLGFTTVNLDNRVGWAEFGTGDEMIAVLGHLDVVPPGDGWDTPPFAAAVKDGSIIGRGAIDNKGPIIAALFALKAIKDAGLQTKRRIRVIFGIDEESGCTCVEYYVNQGKELPVAGFTPDAMYPLINAEKGILHTNFSSELGQGGSTPLLRLSGGTAGNVVPAEAVAMLSAGNPDETARQVMEWAEKLNLAPFIHVQIGAQSVTITATGKSAHASTPQAGENAIVRLMPILANMDIQKTAQEFARYITDCIADYTGAGLGIAMQDEVSGSLTCNLGMAALKTGGITLTATLDIRYPVTKNHAKITQKLTANLTAAGMTCTENKNVNPLYIPEDAPLVRTLLDVYQKQTGQQNAAPLATGGGTYAKCMPNIVAFGPNFPGDPDTFHQPNEFITIDNLMKIAKITAEAMYRLAI